MISPESVGIQLGFAMWNCDMPAATGFSYLSMKSSAIVILKIKEEFCNSVQPIDKDCILFQLFGKFQVVGKIWHIFFFFGKWDQDFALYVLSSDTCGPTTAFKKFISILIKCHQLF